MYERHREQIGMKLLISIIIAGMTFSTAIPALGYSDLDKVVSNFVEAAAMDYSPDASVTDNFIKYSEHGRANDVLLLQLYMSVHLPEKEVRSLLENFNLEEGFWKDIDYSVKDRGRWPATLHLTRLYALAKLYKSPESKWHSSGELSSLLHSGIHWWIKNRPVNPNWWHNDIGVPKKMTAILLMLKDELSQEEIDGGLEILKRSQFGRTGQNKVWLAGNNLMKGLLTNDEALVKEARDYIAEEIFITYNEGIQDDWSFHQHGHQIQFGNYGLAYADSISFWIKVLNGTEYAFSIEQTEILSNMLKEGICWSVFKGIMDPNFCGRQNFINGGTGKAYALAVAAQNMAAVTDSAFFKKTAMENLLPEKYGNSLTGAKYFNRSDCGIYRTSRWYASSRMHSDRTIGFEMTNKENTLANFSSDGAVILMQDGKEFENIFAYWDWRKVPGVTAYDDGRPIKSDDSEDGKKNRTRHVGGLVSGNTMITTMELGRDGLHALKSSFFFEDAIICLGSDITSSRTDLLSVTTAVDQTHLKGKTKSGKNWVWHNQRGYISLDGALFKVSEGLQTGKWDDIDPAFHNKTDEGKVFKCWIEHPMKDVCGKDSKSSSYAYLMLPCHNAKETAGIAGNIEKNRSKSDLKIIRNDRFCQAVSYKGDLCIVFHEAGEYSIGGKEYKVSEPCIKIISGSDSATAQLPVKAVYDSFESIEEISERIFERAAVQFKVADMNLGKISDEKGVFQFPRSISPEGDFVTSSLRWWCSGFYPGSLWLTYEYGKDENIKALAEKYTEALEPLRFRKDDHDVGFQIMCSYGNSLRLTGDKNIEPIIIDAAHSLATRFNKKIGCTRSWNHGEWSFPVIIDNMMNMELLLKGYELCGDEKLKEIALSHARTTMKNHFRPDFSSYHLVDYNPETGDVVKKQTVQGFADNSAWSRGQAWGVYAYTMMYAYTREKDMLDQAVKIAEYIIRRLPEDGIPYWDFDSGSIPEDFRDASAAAIMASGLIQLSQFTQKDLSEKYLKTAEKQLRSLAGEDYLAEEGSLYGFLLKHSVGNKPGNSEVDVPLTYADYYFLEALLRYCNL